MCAAALREFSERAARRCHAWTLATGTPPPAGGATERGASENAAAPRTEHEPSASIAELLRGGGPVVIESALDSADTVSLGPGAQPVTARPPSPPVERIDRYIVVGKLGTGAMGEVYAAYDPELDRKVAVKLLLESAPSESDDMRARLFREAQTMARLTHPNVVTVHDVGVSDGRVFIAMELSEGTTLRQWQLGRHAWRERVRFYVAAGRGLAAAHAAGIVHRDFKPDNVLVGKDGAVKVTDFGIAQGRKASPTIPPELVPGKVPPAPPSSGRSLPPVPLTEVGTVMGTPGYMAPEQYVSAATDPRTDQFSFCASLYEALYGEKPFEGATFDAQMLAVTEGRVRPARRGSRIPARVRRILLRGLSREPAARYPSMEALLADLQRDRGRTLQLAFAALGLGVVAVATTVGVQRAAAARDAMVCSGAAPLMAEVWNDEQKSVIAAAFERSGARNAGEAWSKAREGLDAYAERWAAAHHDACEATRVRGVQTEAAMQLRMTCLEQRRRQLGALARHLTSPDAEVIGKAAQAAYSLADIDACSDVLALTTVEPLPAAPDARAGIDAMRRELSEIRAVSPFGQVDVVVPRVRALRDRARAAGFAPLLADVALEMGALLHVAGDPLAVDTYKEAILAAERGRADDVKVAAEAALAHLLANRHRFDESREWLALGRATAAHADRRLEARLWKVEGWLEYEQDHFDRSNDAFKHALPAYAEFFPRSPDYALTMSGAAMVALMAGDAPRATELSAQSDALAIALFGEGSAFRAGILSNRSALLLEGARYEEALAASDAALALAAGLPATQNRVMMAHFNRVEALLGLARIDDARADLETETRILSAAGMDTLRDDYGRKWRRLRAKLFVLAGEHASALPILRALIPERSPAKGPPAAAKPDTEEEEDDVDDAVSQSLFGEAELGLHAPREAIPHLRAALAIMGREKLATPARLEETAVATLLLGEALVDSGGGRDEARRLLGTVSAASLVPQRRGELDVYRARLAARP